jgi:lipid-A-disaccharide synthase
VEFVGHPLSELEPPKVSREEFARRWKLDTARSWIALLPGSRRKELRLNLPAMLEAAERLGSGFEFVMPVANTLDKDWVREQIAMCARKVEVKLTDDARASLLHARVGVVASGTATVEAALIGMPFVMVYRVAGLTWTLGRHLVKLPHYGMVNLVAGREVVPELIQDGFTPESVEREVKALLEDGEARQRMKEALAEVRGMLRGALTADSTPGGTTESAAYRAARAILRVAESAVRERE